MKKEYYLGLDIGTNSVGYAVTDTTYKLQKYKGEPMWGSHVFEDGKQCAERRGYRTGRRRLDRRQQRVRLVQELFASEIDKVDPRFFLRLKESALYREDTNGNDPYVIFNDAGYTDKEYYAQYPTIHHLIVDLIENSKPHDVRLVYMAVAWLVAHRGHFLSEVDKNNVKKILEFQSSYESLKRCYSDNDCEVPWKDDQEIFQKTLLEKCGVKDKENLFKERLFDGKPIKNKEDECFGTQAVIKLLSGGTADISAIFPQDEFAEKQSVSFKMAEEEFEALLTEYEEQAEFLIKLRGVYDWALLYEAAGGQTLLSKAKVNVYEQHKEDLKNLKYFIRKYVPEKYDDMFRNPIEGSYVMYSHNLNSVAKDVKRPNRISTQESFCAYVKKMLKNVVCEEEEQQVYQDMMLRLDLGTFMPKQVTGDNRVIPYQLYYHELNELLNTASSYLPFLAMKDRDGYQTKDKLLSIMCFRVPYYVGPLHDQNSSFAWIQRKANGRIYPWNFDEKVDLDASEQKFIDRMTNQCSYLPGEDVLPKYSLCYCRFEVLNEINNIKINGIPVSAECKQGVYGLFEKYKKVSRKRVVDYLKSNNYMTDSDEMTGLDVTVKSSLKSYHDFKRLLTSETLTEEQAEDIIKHLTYTEDKRRIRKYLDESYSTLAEEDRKYLANLKYKDFGRLSRKFLTELKGVDKKAGTGEIVSIMHVLWNTNDNMMQIIFSDRYTFKQVIEEEQKQYYAQNPKTVDQLLTDLYVPNAVKRSIYRTLDVVKDVKKACGCAPKKIFVEMARGGGEKGKRTVSRRDQIKELYKKMDKQEVRELSELLEGKTDNQLQSEVLFLYFMQLGKCMYSGKAIDIERLKIESYVNVDHIYPQAYVKDDSLNNKVLVMSELNGQKSDKYPIQSEIRQKMAATWKHYRDKGLITEEKYNRLTRSMPFSDEEKQGFINRQLVETRQSTKAVTEILKTMFSETEIVYVKAGLASDFKHAYGIVKSREINDLHHAKDAYLNIVCGNVYHCKFTKNFFLKNQTYSIKTETVYKNPIKIGEEVIWNGQESISKVLHTVSKNNVHYTRYAFCRKGGFFDQMPVPAKEGLVPRKSGLDTARYGGYNKTTASFFIMTRYIEKKKKEKREMMLVPVDLMVADQVLKDKNYAIGYLRKEIAEITNCREEEITQLDFPMGLKPLKINTRFKFDGFEMCLTGKSGGGRQLCFASATPLIIAQEQERYIKRIASFIEKNRNNAKITPDEEHDHISRNENIKIYDILRGKLNTSVYKKIFSSQKNVFECGIDSFEALDIQQQCSLLLNIVDMYKTGRASKCDFSMIGGSPNAASLLQSSKLSNWCKSYNVVTIINESASGIYRQESDNILEWL